MSFAAGLLAGIFVTVLAGFFVFRARAVAGRSSGRRVDLRALVALSALVIAVVAFVRSGNSDSHTAPSSTTTTVASDTESAEATTTAPSATSTTGPTSTTTVKAVLVKVPNVVGLAQADATAQLRAKSLQIRVQPLPLNNIPPGFVVAQTPGAFSTTTTNSIVILSVSSRP